MAPCLQAAVSQFARQTIKQKQRMGEQRTEKEENFGFRPSAERKKMINSGTCPVSTCMSVNASSQVS